jgi:hypothetical protein
LTSPAGTHTLTGLGLGFGQTRLCSEEGDRYMSLVFCAMWQAVFVVSSISSCCVLSLVRGLPGSLVHYIHIFSIPERCLAKSAHCERGDSGPTRHSDKFSEAALSRDRGRHRLELGRPICPLPKPRQISNTHSRGNLNLPQNFTSTTTTRNNQTALTTNMRCPKHHH